MNVPNRYKGFSQLPENVQQRMDPSLAKKYQMGGSVMQRPLFRQLGGPAQMTPQDMMPPPAQMAGPPMPPPPMAPPPMDPMAEQMMAAESMGESAGANVADAMMMQIDGAQDYESLIDGIRGNELPLDARYQELAGLVGEADAMATPESVLALTQPTIMMTEQGAMDSGIGELMQGIAGDVEMSGPMDDGVGSLMAAGAGNTPPVNFRNGGPVEVRGYQAAGEVKPGGGAPLSGVIGQAQADAPAYQKYFAGAMDSEARAAQLEEQKKMAQAQMLFDVAGTALAFAGNTEGNTVAERLANAASQTQLTDKIGARSASVLSAKQAQQAEDRQLRMAGLTASLTQAQKDEAAKQEQILAGLKRTPTTTDRQTIYEVNDSGDLTGKFVTRDLNNPVENALYNKAVLSGKYKDEKTVAPLLKAQEVELTPSNLIQRIVKEPIEVNGVKYKAGEIVELTLTELNDSFRGSTISLPKDPTFTTLYKGSDTKLVITNRPDSAKTLTDLSKLGWSDSTIGAETAAKKEILTFGSVLTAARDQKLNQYAVNLANLNGQLNKRLLSIKDKYDKTSIELRAELRDESSKVTAALNVANQLKVAGVKNVYEIANTEKAYERNVAIVKLKSTLADVSRKDQNVFAAAESLLASIRTDKRQLSEQEWKNVQNQMERDFKGTEAEKTAAAKLLQDIATNAMTAEGLDLQEARDLVNQAKSEAKIALDRERFELEKVEKPLLADKGTDATLKALSNQDDLDRYANNTMTPTEANQFDFLIEYWAKKQSEVWSSNANNGRGGYISKENNLSPALKKAIAARVAILGQENVPDLSNAVNFVDRGAPGSVSAYRFNADGTVNFDSFKDDPTLLITGVDLTKAQGLASGFNRFLKSAGSVLGELSFGYIGGEGGPESKRGVTRKADAELDALARKTITLGRAGVEGKVFALDVKLLEDEVKNFRGSAFGTDRTALDQLYVTRSSLALEFGNVIQVLNTGTEGGFTEAQVTAANAVRPQLEELLGEFTAAILIYERNLDTSPSEQANTASDQVQVKTGGSLTGSAPRVTTGGAF